MIEKKPFTSYTLDEDKKEGSGKVFAIRLNEEELISLKSAQNLLQQEKQSTCIKQLVTFGMFVLQERSTGKILEVLTDNLRKNKRIGIERVELKIPKNEHL